MTEFDDKGQLSDSRFQVFRETCQWSQSMLRKLLRRWDELDEDRRISTVRSVAEALDERSNKRLVPEAWDVKKVPPPEEECVDE